MNKSYEEHGKKWGTFLKGKMQPNDRIKKSFVKIFPGAEAVEWHSIPKVGYLVRFTHELKQKQASFTFEGKLQEIRVVLSEKELSPALLKTLQCRFGFYFVLNSVWEIISEQQGFELIVDLPNRTRHKVKINSKGEIEKSELIFIIDSGTSE